MKKDYFFSGWMANLGVVPLFRSSLLRFAPIFFRLLALQFIVCCVLDAMMSLLKKKYHQFCFYFPTTKGESLSKMRPLVKAFLFFSPLSANCLTLEPLETHILKTKNLQQFHFTVPYIVQGTRSKGVEGETLTLKALKEGQSDLILFFRNHRRKKLSLKVKAKVTRRVEGKEKKESGHSQIEEWAKSAHLNITHRGSFLIIEGMIRELEDYQRSLRHQSPSLIWKTKLSPKLRNQIIGEIYYLLLHEYVEELSCVESPPRIRCYYNKVTPPSTDLLRQLQEKYGVEFLGWNPLQRAHNFHLRMKIFQMERSDGAEFSFGLNQFSSSLEALLKRDIQSWSLQQKVLLEQHQLKLTTLAEPETLIRLNSKLSLQMGQKIPFLKEGKDNIHIVDWQFAGLLVKLKIKDHGEKLQLNYHVELTSPMGQSIQGNHETSSLFLKSGETIELFQLSLQSATEELQNFPLLHSLPLIGPLFRSTGQQNAYKKICGLLLVEEEHATHH